jgi:cobalt/nickel transport system permease protein
MPQAAAHHFNPNRPDGRAILISVILFISAVLFIDVRNVSAVLLAVFWLTGYLFYLRVPIRDALRPLLPGWIMILAISWPLIFSPAIPDQTALFRFGLLRIYAAGLQRFLDMNIRLLLILLITIIMRSRLSFPEMIRALHSFGLPHWLLAILTQMYRLMFLLGDELQRMRRAFKSRAANIGFGRRITATAGMTGVYFARIISRSDRAFAAMISRGFNGHFPHWDTPAWRLPDTLLVLAAGIFLLLAVLWP